MKAISLALMGMKIIGLFIGLYWFGWWFLVPAFLMGWDIRFSITRNY